MGRSDEKQERNYGNKIYAGDKLCGTWPKEAKDAWIEFECPEGTKNKTVKVVKPDTGILTLCGIKVFGFKKE
jgi:hypothetical protein